MRVKEFIEKNPEIKGIHVSADGRWYDGPRKGFEYQTREEILGTASLPEQKDESQKAPEKAKEEVKTEIKKDKKNKK